MTFVYDIVNLEIFVVIFLFIVAYYLRLEPLKVFLLFGHILAIFILNDVLFSPSYFGDQRVQLDAAKIFRYGVGQYDFPGWKVAFPSLIFSFFPIPFINSVQSIAMINFIIFLLMFLFIKKANLSNNSVDYFYLLYPSLLLYSSLALRDTLILSIMMIGVYIILIREKYIIGLIVSSPIFLLKFQNYLMIIGALIIFFYLKKASKWRYIFLAIFVVIASFIPEKVPIVADLYGRLERWRLALFYDQYMYNWEYIEQMNISALYQPLGSGFILLYQMLKNFFYMLLKPFLWECDNPFQLIQSFENLVIFAMIIWVNWKKIVNEKIKQKIMFLNCLLFVSMTINGLVIFNFGSAVRYKYPFMVIYFVYFFYFLRNDELIVKQLQTAWSHQNGLKPTTI